VTYNVRYAVLSLEPIDRVAGRVWSFVRKYIASAGLLKLMCNENAADLTNEISFATKKAELRAHFDAPCTVIF
jgi:hypothetical protein